MPLSAATLYFLEYWEDVWSGVSSKRDLLKSFNPRVVIQELLDEITFNKLQNKANEEFFRRTIGAYLKSDPGCKRRLHLPLILILKEFDLSKRRPIYLPHLCESALNSFRKLHYFEDCVEALVELTASANLNAENKSTIRTITNHLIVELREAGYGEEEIRKAAQNIFSEIRDINGICIWDFPHSISYPDESTEEARVKFYQQLETYQALLTEHDRLRALLILAKRQPEKIRYIFRTNGLLGNQCLEVGDVLFYPPHTYKLVDEVLKEKLFIDETFQDKGGDKCINASVWAYAVSSAGGELSARAKVEMAFAYLRNIMQGESPLWISKSYIALPEGGGASTSNHTFERDDQDWTKAFTLDDDHIVDARPRLEAISSAIKAANINGWERRLSEAVHWLRKADEASSPVEKLLSYWICIETLCAKTEASSENWFETKNGQEESDIFLIREVVGKMRALGKCFEHGWILYRRLANPIFRVMHEIQLPEELISSAQLSAKPGESVQLANIVRDSAKIETYLPDGILKDQFAELRLFYSDRGHALRVLQEHRQTTQDELLLLYRMRNKIAHDGSSSHPLLPSLCKIASDYSRTLFSKVVQSCNQQGMTSLSGILIKSVQEFERIECRLKTEDPTTVFLNMPAQVT